MEGIDYIHEMRLYLTILDNENLTRWEKIMNESINLVLNLVIASVFGAYHSVQNA
jgi:hypothetical protein